MKVMVGKLQVEREEGGGTVLWLNWWLVFIHIIQRISKCRMFDFFHAPWYLPVVVPGT